MVFYAFLSPTIFTLARRPIRVQFHSFEVSPTRAEYFELDPDNVISVNEQNTLKQMYAFINLFYFQNKFFIFLIYQDNRTYK